MKIVIDRLSEDFFLARIDGASKGATAQSAGDAVLKALRKVEGIEFHEIDQREDPLPGIATPGIPASQGLPAGELLDALVDTHELMASGQTTGLTCAQAEAALHSGKKAAPEAWKDDSYLVKDHWISGGHWGLAVNGKEPTRHWPISGMTPEAVAATLQGSWRIVE